MASHISQRFASISSTIEFPTEIGNVSRGSCTLISLGIASHHSASRTIAKPLTSNVRPRFIPLALLARQQTSMDLEAHAVARITRLSTRTCERYVMGSSPNARVAKQVWHHWVPCNRRVNLVHPAEDFACAFALTCAFMIITSTRSSCVKPFALTNKRFLLRFSFFISFVTWRRSCWSSERRWFNTATASADLSGEDSNNACVAIRRRSTATKDKKRSLRKTVD